MADTGISALDNATHQANIWLNELCDLTHWEDKRHAYRLLRSVLHALRDWLNPDEAADFAAQLPMLIRGIYYEGWNPSATPVKQRGKDDFVDRLQTDFKTDPLGNPDLAITAVFTLLSRHMTGGELDQVRNSMQKPLRDLWPAAWPAQHR